MLFVLKQDLISYASCTMRGHAALHAGAYPLMGTVPGSPVPCRGAFRILAFRNYYLKKYPPQLGDIYSGSEELIL